SGSASRSRRSCTPLPPNSAPRGPGRKPMVSSDGRVNREHSGLNPPRPPGPVNPRWLLGHQIAIGNGRFLSGGTGSIATPMKEQGNALMTGPDSSDVQATLAGGSAAFPFRTEFSLAPLIDFWLRAGDDGSPICAALARLVGEEIQKAPELTGTITDPAVLD